MNTIAAAVSLSIHHPSSPGKSLGLFCLLVISLLVHGARAQLVSDGVTQNQATSTNLSGNLIVGTNSGNTTLNISAPAVVKNANGYIGFNAASLNNSVNVQNSGASWQSSGALSVGNSGSGNQLVVSSGAGVSSLGGILGSNTAAINNSAVITGAGSHWNSGVISVGLNGAGNRLVVSNGAAINTVFNGSVGENSTATSNRVLITGAASQWNSSGGFSIGIQGSGNQLVLSNGGTMFVDETDAATGDGHGIVGSESAAGNNLLVVTDSGSSWTNIGDLYVGLSGAGNQLVVSNGAAIHTFYKGSIGENSTANNNRAVITGAASLWNCNGDFYVGNYGSGNQLVVSAGAVVRNYLNGHIGEQQFAINNTALVTGPGSLWTNHGDLFVGGSGGSQLSITDSGTVAANNLTLGANSPALTVQSGTLFITNNLGSTLNITGGTCMFSAGLITANTLLLTSETGFLQFNSGTLNARQATVANGALFNVGNNSSSATYFMSGTIGDLHSFANGLKIANNAILTGNGTINGALTVAPGGTLTPGASIGKIVLNTPPVLQGKVVMEISRSGANLTNDQIDVAGALSYGGSLIVSNLGPDTLVLGNSFKLFNATSYSGAFSQITLPALAAGLVWTNQLLASGTIALVAAVAPTVTTLAASGVSNTVATLNATINPGGAATTTWFEWRLTPPFYSQKTPDFAVGSGVVTSNLSQALTGLTQGSVYHFRAVASNSVGVARGKDLAFGSPALVLNGPAVITNVANTSFNDPGATARIGPLAITAGGSHSLALRFDGTVVAWGTSNFGVTNVPGGLSNVVAISAGSIHNLALQANGGTIVPWGNNTFGQSTIPESATNAMAVAAGGLHSLSLVSGGKVVGWGYNSYGQTSIPTTATNNVLAIAAGYFHSLALKNGGTVVAWGAGLTNDPASGQDAGQSIIPIGLSNVLAIAAGDYHSLALRADGTVVAWGNNSSGQTNVPPSVTNVVAIAGGGNHCLALRADGMVIAWGENGGGQTNVPQSATNTAVIAGGAAHSLALRGDGVVIAWGYNDSGQTNVPVAAFNLPVVVIGSVATNTPGNYLLTYTATNALGGVSTITRTVVVVAQPAPFTLAGIIQMVGGAFQLSFTNLAALSFTVLASTNIALPLASWTVLGTAAESPAGHYQFVDPQATNNGQHFYRVRSL